MHVVMVMFWKEKITHFFSISTILLICFSLWFKILHILFANPQVFHYAKLTIELWYGVEEFRRQFGCRRLTSGDLGQISSLIGREPAARAIYIPRRHSLFNFLVDNQFCQNSCELAAIWCWCLQKITHFMDNCWCLAWFSSVLGLMYLCV